MGATLIRQGPYMRCVCGDLSAVITPRNCVECGAPLSPFPKKVEVPPLLEAPAPLTPPDPYDYSTRTDAAGIEWFVCDPYPTYYRRVGGLYTDIVVRDPETDAPWPTPIPGLT